MTKSIITFCLICLFVTCKKKGCETQPAMTKLPAENWFTKYGTPDKYIPSKDGNYWIYEVKTYDSMGLRLIGLDTLTMHDTLIHNNGINGIKHKLSPIKYCHLEPHFVFSSVPYDTFTQSILYKNSFYPLMNTVIPDDSQVLFNPLIFKTNCMSSFSGGVYKMTINGITYDSTKTASFNYGISKVIDGINTRLGYSFTFTFAKNIGIVSMRASYTYQEANKKDVVVNYYYNLKDYKLN